MKKSVSICVNHYARYAEVWPVLKISLKFSF